MSRKPFTPTIGKTYRNQGGGTYTILRESAPDVWRTKNTASGWVFDAHGVGVYDDGTIDWDYSTGGFFEPKEYRNVRLCQICGKEFDRSDMHYTKDCHGIAFRLACFHCWEKAMSKGYDGEYYDEADEQIEADY